MFSLLYHYVGRYIYRIQINSKYHKATERKHAKQKRSKTQRTKRLSNWIVSNMAIFCSSILLFLIKIIIPSGQTVPTATIKLFFSFFLRLLSFLIPSRGENEGQRFNLILIRSSFSGRINQMEQFRPRVYISFFSMVPMPGTIITSSLLAQLELFI